MKSLENFYHFVYEDLSIYSSKFDFVFSQPFFSMVDNPCIRLYFYGCIFDKFLNILTKKKYSWIVDFDVASRRLFVTLTRN